MLLKDILDSKGIKANFFASKIGISSSYFYLILNGKRAHLGNEVISKILKALKDDYRLTRPELTRVLEELTGLEL